MTGIEPTAIAGAGKAVAKIAGKAIEEDPKDRAVLRQLAEKSGELEPAARAYAKRLAVKEQVRLKIWQPLGRLLGMSREYFEIDFTDDMAERLKDVPEENLVTPKGSIAGPAFQGLGFTVEEPELRAMYLNLLATASDTRVRDSAHPSFAEVIRQLAADEASALAGVLAAPAHPIVEIRAKLVDDADATKQGRGYTVVATHVMHWCRVSADPDGTPVAQQVAAPERAMFVDNWLRLGLVTVDYVAHLTPESAYYNWVETSPLVVSARERYDTTETKRIACQRGVLKVTDFGAAFERAVIAPVTPTDGDTEQS